jgi:hypothetical protein
VEPPPIHQVWRLKSPHAIESPKPTSIGPREKKRSEKRRRGSLPYLGVSSIRCTRICRRLSPDDVSRGTFWKSAAGQDKKPIAYFGWNKKAGVRSANSGVPSPKRKASRVRDLKELVPHTLILPLACPESIDARCFTGNILGHLLAKWSLLRSAGPTRKPRRGLPKLAQENNVVTACDLIIALKAGSQHQ